MEPFEKQLHRQKIIPAVKGVEELECAISAGAEVAVALGGDIFSVIAMSEIAREHDLRVFLHIDLTEGIGRDKAGLRFLAQRIGISGIVSTRAHLVRDARAEGLLSILRFFVLDSIAYQTGVNMVRSAKPDAIELLPGIVLPRIADRVSRDIKPPVIAAGLIRTPEDVRDALRSGAVAISTTHRDLWRLRI